MNNLRQEGEEHFRIDWVGERDESMLRDNIEVWSCKEREGGELFFIIL